MQQVGQNLKNYATWKKPDRKGQIGFVVWFHRYKVSRIGTSIETESILVVARAEGREKGSVTANEYRVSFWGDKLFWN